MRCGAGVIRFINQTSSCLILEPQSLRSVAISMKGKAWGLARLCSTRTAQQKVFVSGLLVARPEGAGTIPRGGLCMQGGARVSWWGQEWREHGGG